MPEKFLPLTSIVALVRNFWFSCRVLNETHFQHFQIYHLYPCGQCRLHEFAIVMKTKVTSHVEYVVTVGPTYNELSYTEHPFLLINNFGYQWRIQDFPEEGGLTPKGGEDANLLFGQFSPKTASKWRNFGQGGARPSPPLRSATGYYDHPPAMSSYFCDRFCFIW